MTEPGRSISFVLPVYNERDSLAALLAEIEASAASLGGEFEIVFVDDGSDDGSSELIAELAGRNDRVVGVFLRKHLGKSDALAAGFEEAGGDVIVTLDSDGQDDPAETGLLIAALDDGADLASGWKRDRKDPWTRRWASRVFNRMTSLASGLRLHDFNCGFKAYRAECAKSIDVYGELHRFLPVLADQQGWRVVEVPVNHRPRQHGRSKFGLERYRRGLLDLLTVMFIGRYRERPLHLFGGLGLLLSAVGAAVLVYLLVVKILGEAIGNRPLLILGVLLFVVGVQLVSLGLLAQMLIVQTRTAARRGSGRPPTVARVVRGARSLDSPRIPA